MRRRSRQMSIVPSRGGPLFVAASLTMHVAIALAVFRSNRAASPDGTKGTETLSGETFELAASLDETLERKPEEPSNAAPAATTETQTATNESAPNGVRAPRAPPRQRHAHALQAATRGAESKGATLHEAFGAVGDRSAMDLATAFTRSFPIAASGDPLWLTAPLGSAATAEIAFTIDATGSLLATHLEGSPSRSLESGIRRTVALLRNRMFTARGASTHLAVRVLVSPDEHHDGLHGDVFALGAGFRGHDGTAFFALAVGRRIDLHVSERR
jgi:hypothetical protein